MVRIGLIGDFDPNVAAHVAIPSALELVSHHLNCSIEPTWLPTPGLEEDVERKLSEFNALWAVPRTPYESMHGALNGIQFARVNGIPFLGTCGGFQHLLIEYARNVLHLTNADHAESNPDAKLLVVTPLSCSMNEQTHQFSLSPGSKVHGIYGKDEITEQYGICNYGLNADFRNQFENRDLRVVGVDGNGEARIVELHSHPFFIGTLFQPERSAFRQFIHPLIQALVLAAM